MERQAARATEDARRAIRRADAVDQQVALLDRRVQETLYRVGQEALTNVAKHARASAVTITAEADAAVLRLVVRDDGAGGADFTRGTGMIGLKDRVEAIGGRLFLDSPPGAGTSLQAELPLTSATASPPGNGG